MDPIDPKLNKKNKPSDSQNDENPSNQLETQSDSFHDSVDEKYNKQKSTKSKGIEVQSESNHQESESKSDPTAGPSDKKGSKQKSKSKNDEPKPETQKSELQPEPKRVSLDGKEPEKLTKPRDEPHVRIIEEATEIIDDVKPSPSLTVKRPTDIQGSKTPSIFKKKLPKKIKDEIKDTTNEHGTSPSSTTNTADKPKLKPILVSPKEKKDAISPEQKMVEEVKNILDDISQTDPDSGIGGARSILKKKGPKKIPKDDEIEGIESGPSTITAEIADKPKLKPILVRPKEKKDALSPEQRIAQEVKEILDDISQNVPDSRVGEVRSILKKPGPKKLPKEDEIKKTNETSPSPLTTETVDKPKPKPILVLAKERAGSISSQQTSGLIEPSVESQNSLKRRGSNIKHGETLAKREEDETKNLLKEPSTSEDFPKELKPIASKLKDDLKGQQDVETPTPTEPIDKPSKPKPILTLAKERSMSIMSQQSSATTASTVNFQKGFKPTLSNIKHKGSLARMKEAEAEKLREESISSEDSSLVPTPSKLTPKEPKATSKETIDKSVSSNRSTKSTLSSSSKSSKKHELQQTLSTKDLKDRVLSIPIFTESKINLRTRLERSHSRLDHIRSKRTLTTESQGSDQDQEPKRTSTKMLLTEEKEPEVEQELIVDQPSEESIRVDGFSNTAFFRRSARNFCQLYWRYLFAWIWPIVLCLIFILSTSKKIRCLYVELLMWGYWTFDIFPEAVTALIPIFALPALMIQHAYTSCTIYFQYGLFALNTTFISICLDYSGLHERIIFYLMFKFGGTPRVVHLVLASVCGLISIRIANAYTAQLMLPIIKKILYEVDIMKIEESRLNVAISKMSFKHHEIKHTPVNLSMAFICGVVYASCFGGLNFVSGTMTNLVFKATYQRRFPNCNIAQTAWYCYTMPLAIIAFLASLAWVQVLYLGLWRYDREVIKEYHLLTKIFKDERIIERLYHRLGGVTLREICMAIAYIIYVIIWYLDAILYFTPNSEKIFFVKFVGESTPFMIITFGLMLLPASLHFLLIFHPNPKKRPHRRSRRLISWQTLQSRTPWGRILVLGASVAMAQAQFSSGLAEAAAYQFSFLKGQNYWILLLFVTLFASLVTETLYSNGIICGILTPLIIEISVLCKVHPVHLGLPFALCCSFGLLHEYSSHLIKKVLEISELPKKQFLIAGSFPKFYGWMLIYFTFDIYGKTILHEGAISNNNFLDKNISCYCEPCIFNNTFFQNW